MEKPLTNKQYLLEKYPGKGGWTYAVIEEIPPDKRAHFGWVKVKGTIDSYEIKNYNLMPMGNGKLFLPVKAEIRKKIRKKEGDWVTIVLYADNDPLEIPEDLLICLLEEPAIHQAFLNYGPGEQKMFVDWINSAKRMETKVTRIATTMEKVGKGIRFWEKMEE